MPLPAKLNRLLYNFRTYAWMVDPRRFLPKGKAPIDRPIFLLGTQGGGLTLLSRMLRRHPDAISVAGNSRYWTASDEMQNVLGLILPFELSGVRYNAPPHPKFPPPRGWSYAGKDLFPLYRKQAEDATPEIAKALKDAIRLAMKRHGKGRFVDKSQSFSVRVGLIYEVLKDCDPRFVLVPRDPYVSVYRAAQGKPADMARIVDSVAYPERVQVCAEHYANSMRSVIEDGERHHLPIHLLRFEDLLNDPRAKLQEVCDFVDLPFREDMLPAAHHRLPMGSRYLDRWYPIKPNINQGYAIDDLTIETVNRCCGDDLLQRLGYAQRSPGEKSHG